MTNENAPENIYPWVTDELLPVAMRLARVDQLAYEAGALATHWSRRAPLTIKQVRRDEMNHLIAEAVSPIPPLAALLFSEAINHLRAAIDNALLIKLESIRAEPLTEAQIKSVAFPIHTDPDKLAEWTKASRKKGLKELTEGSLADSILNLQPFNDKESSAPIYSQLMALGFDSATRGEHPLLLLQAYSNADKHRQLRLAAAGAFVMDANGDFATSLDSALEAGQTLYSLPVGVRALIDTYPYVAIQRATSGEWAGIGRELNALQRYVADTAIPMIMTGLAHPKGLPPQIDLDDNVQDLRQRLNEGQWTYAHERIGELALSLRTEEDFV